MTQNSYIQRKHTMHRIWKGILLLLLTLMTTAGWGQHTVTYTSKARETADNAWTSG